MVKSNVVEVSGRDTIADPLTELLRAGAEQLIYRAVEGELADLLSRHLDRRLEDGKAGVVRNGYLPERELQTGLGPVTVKIPKVRAKMGEPVTFHSALVPPVRRAIERWWRIDTVRIRRPPIGGPFSSLAMATCAMIEEKRFPLRHLIYRIRVNADVKARLFAAVLLRDISALVITRY